MSDSEKPVADPPAVDAETKKEEEEEPAKAEEEKEVTPSNEELADTESTTEATEGASKEDKEDAGTEEATAKIGAVSFGDDEEENADGPGAGGGAAQMRAADTPTSATGTRIINTVPKRPTMVETKGIQWKPVPSKKNKYWIDILREEDIEGAAHCFARIFCEREILAKAVNATYEETLPFGRALAKAAAKAELSTVARVQKTGEVVGFCISEDYVRAELEEAAEACPPSLEPVFMLLDNVHHEYRRKHMKDYGRPPIGGEIHHVLAVGVLKAHAGKNLSKKITVCNQKLAYMKGFKLTAGEATGHASQHLVKKYSIAFKTIIYIKYDAFDYNGTNPFKDLDPPSCMFATSIIKKHGNRQPNAALWVPDNDASECMQCEKKFTVTRRRHHCRHCGNLICADCSLSRVVLPGFDYKKTQRVCDMCVSRAFLNDREDIQADEDGLITM